MATHTVEISDNAFEAAKRTAAADNVDVKTLVEGLVLRHAEYVQNLNEAAAETSPRFSLDDYVMQRDPGESDTEYETRLGLFQ